MLYFNSTNGFVYIIRAFDTNGHTEKIKDKIREYKTFRQNKYDEIKPRSPKS